MVIQLFLFFGRDRECLLAAKGVLATWNGGLRLWRRRRFDKSRENSYREVIMDIFIWKCGCGYIELWEEFDDVKDDPRRYFTKECPKCKGMMTRQQSLREFLKERG